MAVRQFGADGSGASTSSLLDEDSDAFDFQTAAKCSSRPTSMPSWHAWRRYMYSIYMKILLLKMKILVVKMKVLLLKNDDLQGPYGGGVLLGETCFFFY